MNDNGLNTQIPNWGSTENSVCKGYIYKAIEYYNRTYGYYDDSIDDCYNFFNCLIWAFDDMTAQKAFEFYNDNCLDDFFEQ